MTAVVTGGAGWLGQALVAALVADGRRVRCLVRDGTERDVVARLGDVEAVAGDVRAPTAVGALFDGLSGHTVFHLAGVIHPTDGTRQFYDVNVGGTANVVDTARRSGASRLVHVSSNSPFGVARDPATTFDEDSPYRPLLGYGRSKMEAEQLVRRARLDAVIVRAPWFYGPFQPPRQTRFFAAVRRGIFPMFGPGRNRRSMVYTDNLVDGLLRAASTPAAAGRAYWIADARPYPMREILDTVRQALADEGLEVAGRSHVRAPAALADIAGIADATLQRAGRYSQSIHVLSEMNKTIACSIDRARAELGYEPRVDLREGMRRSIRWCVQEGHPI
jgi:nucleoside-diphosphate-sugar epimerase